MIGTILVNDVFGGLSLIHKNISPIEFQKSLVLCLRPEYGFSKEKVKKLQFFTDELVVFASLAAIPSVLFNKFGFTNLKDVLKSF